MSMFDPEAWGQAVLDEVELESVQRYADNVTPPLVAGGIEPEMLDVLRAQYDLGVTTGVALTLQALTRRLGSEILHDAIVASLDAQPDPDG